MRGEMQSRTPTGQVINLTLRSLRLCALGVERGYRSGPLMFEFVTQAKAGVQSAIALRHWIPAFAGMMATFYFIGPEQ